MNSRPDNETKPFAKKYLSKTSSRNTKRTTWIWNTLTVTFLVLSGLVFAIQQINFAFAVEHGLTIPDSLNITQTLENKWISGEIFEPDNEFLMIAIIYGWTWMIHPSLCYVVNILLIVYSTRKFKELAVHQLGAPDWSVLGIVLNPYLILATPGPNKEIPLLLLTIWLCSILARRDQGWLVISIALSVLTYFFRDGYGLLFLFCTLLVWILGRKEWLLSTIVCTALFFISGIFGTLTSIIPTFSRNVEIYESVFTTQAAAGAIATSLDLDPFSFFGGIVLFSLRLLYNLLSLAMFPIVITSKGDIYWIGLSYWVCGLLILATIPYATISQLIDNKKNRIIHLFEGIVVSTWFMVSISLFVQPRYLMPILPIAFLAICTSSRKLRNLYVTIALAIPLLYTLINATIGNLPSVTLNESFSTPAYIW